MEDWLDWAIDGAFVAALTVIGMAGVVGVMDASGAFDAQHENAAYHDHRCPDMPEDIRAMAYSVDSDVAAVRAALREALTFWEACRLGSSD